MRIRSLAFTLLLCGKLFGNVENVEFLAEYNCDNLMISEYSDQDRMAIWQYKYLEYPIEKFTKEQWEVLLSGNASYAFQDGSAHIDWNTDRSIIFKAIEKKFERLSSWTDAEVWYTVVQTEYGSPNGLFFRLTERIPYMLSNERRNREIKLIDENEVTPKLTHTAVIISVDCNGKAYIKNQTTGTLAACEQFVERNMESGTFFKIMERK